MSESTPPPDSIRTLFELQRLSAEVDELNILLDDSNLTISCLFQLLRDHNVQVGSTELINAREKVEAEMQALRTANAALVEKVAETQAALDLSARQLLETVNDRNSIGVQLDLLRDELMRIQARIAETGLIGEHPQLSSIAAYCERAQKDIAVQYTPIQERDRLGRELTEAKRGAARYEVVRKMNPTDFALLYQRCLHMNLRFDDEVDKIGGIK